MSRLSTARPKTGRQLLGEWRALPLGTLVASILSAVVAPAVSPAIGQAPATAATSAVLPSAPDREARLFALSLLWSEARRSFAYFDKLGPGFNWDSVYRAAIPRMLAADDYPTYVRELQRFLATLRDGHTLVPVPDALFEARHWDGPWVSLRALGRRAVVANTDSVLADSVPLGAEVIAVDGTPLATLVERDVLPYLAASAPHVWWSDAIRYNGRTGLGVLAGRADTPIALTLERADGSRRTVRLRRDRGGRSYAWIRPAPAAPLVESRALADGVLYVAINSFNDTTLAARLAELRAQMEQARAIVLDLRRNPGGNSGNGYRALTEHFATRPFTTSAWKSRMEIQARRAWGKQDAERGAMTENRRHWEGAVWFESPGQRMEPTPRVLPPRIPIAVLIGRVTGSAAEDFLIAADGDPRFTLVGEPTNGSTGQPLFLSLPGGVTAWICTKRDTYPDGREFVGRGIEPQVTALETVESVRAGTDVALEAGVRVVMERLAKGR